MQNYETQIKEMLKSGIITEQDASELIKKMKRTKVLELHKAKITEPKKQGSRWQTYIKREDGSDRKISAMSEEKLYDKLYDHYTINQVPTMVGFYDTWVDYRKSKGKVDSTIDRYDDYLNKYYLPHPISKKQLNKITKEDLEKFYNPLIEEGMTYKLLCGMRVILKNMMEYGCKQGIISYSSFDDAEINSEACIPEEKKSAKTRIFYEDEIDAMFKALNIEMEKYPDITVMHGIKLLFTKGVRVAEIAAIKESDINFDIKEIYINRMESYEKIKLPNGKKEKIITVVPHGKGKNKYAKRWLQLTDVEIEWIKEVIAINRENGFEDDGYLFVDDRGRYTVRAFTYRITKMWKTFAPEVEVKSAHDIRRTVASQMFYGGFDIGYIREYLGHSSKKTTDEYIYNIKKDKENREMLKNCFSGINGLRGTNS
ncbi:putative Integrase family protein [Petrocella atlantisensis]|uniref:Putative Integrase family protein n=1 Tax=Petrocella atlantisensis TaxID=2173034 RepID=A0A3P7NZU3_9FIRM|nr:tyrosine-type recombinase/integrase [Petrocella atlantisensis]VDN48684.1 putative Integrase family protein [Petrocella atlantisensis]